MRRNGQLSRVQAHFKRNRDREKIERALETLESLDSLLNEYALHFEEAMPTMTVRSFTRQLRRNLT